MKKLLCIACSLIILASLTACGEPPTVNNDFSAAFSARCGDTDYAGTLTKDGDVLTIDMTEPYTVQGITFTYQGGKLSVGYAGHSAEATAGYLPGSCIPSSLHGTLPYLPQAEYTETADGTDHFTLPTPNGAAQLTADNGSLLSLTDPNGITYTFE